MIVSQTNGSADGKQPCHVIDKCAASLDEQETCGVGCAGCLSTGDAHDCGGEHVANTHKDAGDGQRRDGKHQRFAELLEVLHHINFPLPFFVVVS